MNKTLRKTRQFAPVPRLSVALQEEVRDLMVSKAIEDGTCELTATAKDGPALDENMMALTRLLGCPAPPVQLKSGARFGNIT